MSAPGATGHRGGVLVPEDRPTSRIRKVGWEEQLANDKRQLRSMLHGFDERG